jgi:tetratricopeptide (TPR) repeat protein
MSKKSKIKNNITKFQIARTLHIEGQLGQARLIYEQILKIEPHHFDALHLLGVLEHQIGNSRHAVELMDRAIKLRPDSPEALNNRGAALHKLNQLEAATSSYNKAIKLRPDYAEAYNNRGLVFRDLNEFEVALENYDKAIAFKPDHFMAYNNRGATLEDLKQYEAAVASYEKSISINPNYVPAHWNKALLLLTIGKLDEGFMEYEWRWKMFPSRARHFKEALWSGKESLEGKSILLYSEQGLGDTIQFSRYVSLVSKLGATVFFEVQNQLANLLNDLNADSQIIVRGSPLPFIDYQCPLLSLPSVFKTNIDSVPSPISYISSDPQKVSYWRIRLKDKQKLRVGLVWSGNPHPDQPNDHSRSIELHKLLEYLPVQFQYVSLQKGIRIEDKQILQLRPDILHFEDELNDFSDTAALCELMDIVISIDTSVAHLAGALGKNVWILLRYKPDWRWLLDRKDCPWYPTAKLYRQEAERDWDGVLDKLKFDISEFNNIAPS